MNIDKRNEYLARDAVLKTLSDDEVASVSMAETAPQLTDGEDYLDLERLDLGVRQARGGAPMGRILPRKAVHADTWRKILTLLPPTGPKNILA